MDITNMPEPLPVSGPRPAIPRVKMLGNITELKSPTRMMLHMAKWPVLSTDVITRMKDATAAAPSTVPERSFCSKAEPTNLPTIALPQEKETKPAAIFYDTLPRYG